MKRVLERVLDFSHQRLVFSLLLIFLFLLPFMDGGTSFLAEMLILILPLPLLILGWSRGELQFENLSREIIWPWLAFLVFAGISVVFSASQLLSIPAFFQLLAAFLFFCLFLLTADKKNLKLVAGLILAAAFLLCLLSCYYLSPGANRPKSGMSLVYALWGHSHLSDYLLLAIPLGLGFLGEAKKRKERFFWGSLLAFYLFSFVLTFSRGAFLVLPLVVAFLIFFQKPKSASQKFLGWLLILLPLGVLVLILIFSFSPIGLRAKQIQAGHWLVRQVVKTEFQAKRLSYWHQAWSAFWQRPMVGFGWGTFEVISSRFQETPFDWARFGHNFYLQVLGEIGIFGFLSFSVLLFFSLRHSWQLVREKKNFLVLGIYGGLIGSCLHSFLDYDWQFPAVFLTFLFLLANLLIRSPRGVGRTSPLGCKCKLVFLAFLTLGFAVIQLTSEYFYKKGDYQKALLLAPWPPITTREVGDRLFRQNFVQAERAVQKIMIFSREDPAMFAWLAEKYLKAGQLAKAAENYQKAIVLSPLGYYQLYPKLGEIDDQLGRVEEKKILFKFWREHLEKTRRGWEVENRWPPSHRLAKIFYLIGDFYWQEKDFDQTLFWWQKATETAPEWSYFYLELARLYIDLGAPKEAGGALKRCSEFYWPKEHCLSFLTNQASDFGLEPGGFWREKILAIPD